MSVTKTLLMRAFGRPQGLLGRLGGRIMACVNADFGTWVGDLLKVGANDRVLEVGFGPGVVIEHLARRTSSGHVAGIDPSREMVAQARVRNADAIRDGRVGLQYGSVESLPFDNESFDKALAINSMQVWPDAQAGLREIRRVMKLGGRIALGFTRHSGQADRGVAEALGAAGFARGSCGGGGRRKGVLRVGDQGGCRVTLARPLRAGDSRSLCKIFLPQAPLLGHSQHAVVTAVRRLCG
jgi:SAM-dependent methyltransferase